MEISERTRETINETEKNQFFNNDKYLKTRKKTHTRKDLIKQKKNNTFQTTTNKINVEVYA